MNGSQYTVLIRNRKTKLNVCVSGCIKCHLMHQHVKPWGESRFFSPETFLPLLSSLSLLLFLHSYIPWWPLWAIYSSWICIVKTAKDRLLWVQWTLLLHLCVWYFILTLTGNALLSLSGFCGDRSVFLHVAGQLLCVGQGPVWCEGGHWSRWGAASNPCLQNPN